MIKPILVVSLFLSLISFCGCEFARVFEASKTGYYDNVYPVSIITDSAITVSLVEKVSDRDSHLYVDVSSKSDSKITINSLQPFFSLIHKNGKTTNISYKSLGTDSVSLYKKDEKYTYEFVCDSLIPKDVRSMRIDFNIQYRVEGRIQKNKGSVYLKRHIYRDVPLPLPHGC